MLRIIREMMLSLVLGVVLVGTACFGQTVAQTSTLNVRDAGAKGDGKTDDTAAFQSALNKVKAAGGGIVTVPAGNYLIKTHLIIPEDVTLEGTFRAPISIDAHTGLTHVFGKFDHDALVAPKPRHGSVLLAVEGKGNANAHPFISMNNNSTLKGLAIFHPEQSVDAPTPYPWAIRGNGYNNSIVDVQLINPWWGVDFGTNYVARHYVKGLYGQPIDLGIFVDNCGDCGRMEDVHFWPFWTTLENDSAVRVHMKERGTAFKFGRTDGEMMINCFAIMYNIGFHFVRGAKWQSEGKQSYQVSSVVLVNGYADGCKIGVLVEDCLPWIGLSLSNFVFHDRLVVKETNKGPIMLTNCTFLGTGHTTSNVEARGAGKISLHQCEFYLWDLLDKGDPAIYSDADRLSVIGCDFVGNRMETPAGNQITLGPNFKSAVVTGNTLRGGRRITVLGKSGNLVESANSTD
ncbi:MAG: glycosyl hydrolase family 28-related protein [Armatimonadota bacterium]